MAADVTGDGSALVPVVQTDTARSPAPAPPGSRGALPKTPHRLRFYTVYGLLALALGGAAAVAAVFASHAISPAPAWSSWRPSGGGLGAEHQIVAHVAPAYRLPSGKQLVDVIAKAPSVTPGNQNIPLHYLAVRGTKGQQDQIMPISSSDSIMFSLCGLGPSCSIASGTASVARGRLVRREILELALYTFKYVGGVNNVIAFMPPRPGAQPQYVVYLTRAELSAQLAQPLDRTLAAKTPFANTIPAREVRTVDATTETRVYTFSLSQTQLGDAVLVLAPLPA